MIKRFLFLFAFLPLVGFFFLSAPTEVQAQTRLAPLGYEPIPCGPDCTTLRIYYNQAPPVGQGWGLMNYNACCGGWSGSAGPANIHETYADYTWGYPYNQGTALVVLQNADTVSHAFTIDFGITEPTIIPAFDSVEFTNYEFLPCQTTQYPSCGTVRIYYDKAPPEGQGWGLINWQNHTTWSGAAGPTNVHENYADFTFYHPYVNNYPTQYVLQNGSDFSMPFTVDWSMYAAQTNQPPSLGSINAPSAPQQVNLSIAASANFTDTGDTHTAVWNWGDGNSSVGTVTESNGVGSVSDTHVYTTPGVYEVQLTVTDSNGASATANYQYVVIYASSTKSVSGSKEFISPIGALLQNPSLSGKADFGFSAQFDAAGNPVAQGTKWASLDFEQGNTSLNFVASAYQWLVVTNNKATLKGTGSLNGVPGYNILIAAIDNSQNNTTDLIRYQIKNASGTVIYDTQPGDNDNADPTTPVSKGKITIK